jgi:hypothetical protein
MAISMIYLTQLDSIHDFLSPKELRLLTVDNTPSSVYIANTVLALFFCKIAN